MKRLISAFLGLLLIASVGCYPDETPADTRPSVDPEVLKIDDTNRQAVAPPG